MLTKPASTTTALRSRIALGGAWTLGGYVVSQTIRFASNLIVTRLLMPEVFGVMAIAMVALVGVTMISDIGLNQAIVQNRRGHESAFVNTVWVAQIFCGLGAAFLAALVALAIWSINLVGWVAPSSAYSDPTLPLVIVGLAATSIVNGFGSTKTATANRTIALARVTIIEVISQIAGVVAMVGFAFQNRDIWSLVFGAWVASILKMALSHMALPGNNNQLEWDHESWKEIRTFGIWIQLSSVLGFLATNLDRILVAAYLPTQSFSLFAIAALLIGSFQEAISRVQSNVCFPAFAEVARDRPKDLRAVYYKFRVPIDAFCLFACGFLFFGGSAIVRLLYDPRYQDAGHILELLSVSLFILRFGGIVQSCLAIGQSKVLLIFTLTRLVGVTILIPASYWMGGTSAVLLAIPLTYFVTFPLVVFFSYQLKLVIWRYELSVLAILPIGCAVGWLFNVIVER